MQISTSMFYDNAASRLSKMSERASVLTTQISTGKKIQQASDDPNAAAQLAELDRKDADAQVYGTNLTLAGSLLDQADGVLTQIQSQLTRAYELANNAATGTQTDESRKNIGTELQSIIGAITGLANTTNLRGQPLFGTPEGTSAVQLNSNGSYSYATTNVSEVPIADGQTVQATESASRIFSLGKDAQGNDRDTLTALSDLAAALTAGGDVSAATAKGLDDIKGAIDQVANVQASVGARGARIDLQQQLLATANTDRADMRSKLQDVDMTDAIVQLQQMMTALSATQASFSKLAGLSLFDYIK